MVEKFCRGVAIQMLHLAAANTFFVKMLVAIASLANVLKNVAKVIRAAEFLHGMVVAESCQLTINTAFSAFFVTVESFSKLLGGKLLIGGRGEKIDQCRSPRGVVEFLLHGKSFVFCNLRMILKL